MNITICKNALHLSSRLRSTFTGLLQVRFTSKIAVEIDSEVLVKMDNDEIKARTHPGIIKHHAALPTQLSETLHRVIGDYPVKNLLKDCKELNKFISARHPPPERSDLRERLHKITTEIDTKMPEEHFVSLSKDEQEKWAHKREQAIKRRLAQRTYAWKPVVYGAYEALVYAIGRGAHEYGILTSILNELRLRDSKFVPRSYFDFGAGVGTGMWAASNFWRDTIFEYYNVDCSREMNELSELILREGNENQQVTLKNVYYRQFLPATETKYDLVVVSHTLFELPNAQSRKEVVLNLWRKCDGYMIIVEEGTRKGSELVNEAREYILSLENADLEGHVFAPCPHDSTCPRHANALDRTPCNFELRYAPLRIGDLQSDNMTARYSYVVLKKGCNVNDPTQKWPRVVRPTMIRSGHVICRMCTADAKLQEVIFTRAKHGKIAYRCAKATRWGDKFPASAISAPFGNEDKTKSTNTVNTNESDDNKRVTGKV